MADVWRRCQELWVGNWDTGGKRKVDPALEYLLRLPSLHNLLPLHQGLKFYPTAPSNWQEDEEM
jgi:hypothetical protein